MILMVIIIDIITVHTVVCVDVCEEYNTESKAGSITVSQWWDRTTVLSVLYHTHSELYEVSVVGYQLLPILVWSIGKSNYSFCQVELSITI